jgi:ABC-2 type transport system permease protein
VTALAARGSLVLQEAAKLPAFLRRDLLVTLSYRAGFVADLLSLFTQALLFYFVGKMIEPEQLPSFGGTAVPYLEFVAIGIAVSVFVQLGLGTVATALRNEQLMGTLESMLSTPTSPSTIQLGSVVFDLVYVPLRTVVFLAVMVLAFGIDLDPGGVLPAVVVLLAFIPFVWGLGVLSAAAIVTFRRGGGITGLVGTLLALAAGAYFPLTLLPGWAQTLAEANPIALALDSLRGLLLGGDGWSSIAADVALLATASAVSLAVGLFAFRQALARERRRGSLGLY